MVNAVGCFAAVATPMIISSKDSAPRHSGMPVIRNFDHVSQSNNYWPCHRQFLRMNFGAVIGYYICFVTQHQADCSTCGHNTERFVRCIEYERASNDYLPIVLAAVIGRRFTKSLCSIACTISDSPPHRRPVRLLGGHHGLRHIE